MPAERLTFFEGFLPLRCENSQVARLQHISLVAMMSTMKEQVDASCVLAMDLDFRMLASILLLSCRRVLKLERMRRRGKGAPKKGEGKRAAKRK